MVDFASFVGMVLLALGMVLTPGPNMIYLASRSVSQGRKAGFISLIGVALGFFCYLFASAFGLSALFVAVPTAYDVIRVAGAIYLGYLAWKILRPNGLSPFEIQELAPHSNKRLFSMGFLTSLLNPKIALMYAAVLPQFISPEVGSSFGQFVQLGMVQVVVSIAVNSLIVLSAAQIGGFLLRRPKAMTIQRWVSGSILGMFAVQILLAKRPAV